MMLQGDKMDVGCQGREGRKRHVVDPEIVQGHRESHIDSSEIGLMFQP